MSFAIGVEVSVSHCINVRNIRVDNVDEIGIGCVEASVRS